MLIVLLAAPAAVHADATPQAAIDRLHGVLLDIMRNADTLGVEGRYRTLEPVLPGIYDFQRMITIAVGSHWAAASEEQRRALEQAFTRFSVANYASRFTGYTGETFEIVGERPGPRDSILIDTRLVRTDGEPVPITYVMRERGGDWRIVDVLLERTISELAVRRSEFARVLDEGGAERLVAVLDERSDTMLKK
jgi:phospholipid transport system substrate-binding protein